MEHQKDANFRYAENEISKFSPSEEKCDKFSKRILGLEKFREIYFELKKQVLVGSSRFRLKIVWSGRFNKLLVVRDLSRCQK